MRLEQKRGLATVKKQSVTLIYTLLRMQHRASADGIVPLQGGNGSRHRWPSLTPCLLDAHTARLYLLRRRFYARILL